MATVTEPIRSQNLGEANRRVRHPLQRLRGYIRWFVIAEALIILISCLAGAFWVGVGVDFFFHRVFKFDWVLDAPVAVRAILLGTAMLAVAFLVDLRKVLQIRVDPERERNRGASAFMVWLARNPSILALFGIAFVCVYYTLWVVIAILRGNDSIGSLGVGFIVAACLALFTVLIVVKRMLYEFRDPALAMVLERRYPQLLGDRLITAVELSDPKEAEQLGYSRAMLENTIQEASQRVDQVHLGEVFRWNRLWFHGGLALFLTVGIYLLCWTTAAVVAAANSQPAGIRQLHELNNVALTSFERIVLLEYERWPPEMLPPVLLETTGVSKDGSNPQFIVSDRTSFSVPSYDKDDDRTGKLPVYSLATEMVIHDSSVKQRWRPMMLGDVRGLDSELSDAPTELPRSWEPRVPKLGWTIDELRVQVGRYREGSLPASEQAVVARLKDMLDRLDVLADDPSMHRQMRKLTVHEPVIDYHLDYEKQLVKKMVKLGARRDVEFIYAGAFTELTEEDKFVIKAGDYVSEPYSILIIPPPSIRAVSVEEDVPAYLYHVATPERVRFFSENYPAYLSFLGMTARLSEEELTLLADEALLKGRRQKLARVSIDMNNVDIPKYISPVGSRITFLLQTNNVELTEKDKKIVCKARDLVTSKEVKLDEIQASYSLREGGKTIALVVPNARDQMEFTFDFWDTRGAKGRQAVQLLTTPDNVPVVSKADPEIIRKDETEYFSVRAEAVIPFVFNISDERGLASIDFTYTIEEKPTAAEEAQRAASVAVGLGLSLSGPEAPFASLFHHRHVVPAFLAQRQKITGRAVVPQFVQEVNFGRQRVKDFLGTRSLPEVLDMTLSRKGNALRMTQDDPPKELKGQLVNRYLLTDLKSLDKYLNISDFDKTSIEASRPLKGLDLSEIHWTDKDDKGQPREVRLKAGEGEYQRQYVMYLTVEVADTNVEREGRGRTPYTRTFTINIVRDEKLGELISKEEKALFDELSKMLDDLKKAKEELVRLRFDLPSVPPAGQPIDFLSYSVRTEAVDKVIREGARVTAKVQSDYERIVLEYRTNRLEQRAKQTHDQVSEPLDRIRRGHFEYARVEVSKLRSNFDDKAASASPQVKLDRARVQGEIAEKEMDRLIDQLNIVLSQMRGLVSYDELSKRIGEIELAVQDALQQVKRHLLIVEGDILRGLEGTPPKKP